MIELGGSIELVGFKDFEPSELVVLKKIIGNFARKFADNVEGYEKLTINIKHVGGAKSNKFEVQTKLMIGAKPVNSDVTENNIFVAIAECLKKIEAQVIKH